MLLNQEVALVRPNPSSHQSRWSHPRWFDPKLFYCIKFRIGWRRLPGRDSISLSII